MSFRSNLHRQSPFYKISFNSWSPSILKCLQGMSVFNSFRLITGRCPPFLILGTGGWQTNPCNELPPSWHPSPVFLSPPVIQVLPKLGLSLLMFVVGKESPEEKFLWFSWKVFLQMGELFGNRLNLKGLVFLISDLGWKELSHGSCDSNLLFLPWN